MTCRFTHAFASRRLKRWCGAASFVAVSLHAPLALGCVLQPLGEGVVRQVLDGRTLVLDNGQEVRLAAIETPAPPAPGEAGPQAKAGLAAMRALEALLAGRPVTLKRLGPSSDRYGRLVAHVFAAGREQSAQQDMLSQGHARVAGEVGAVACASLLWGAERVARAGRLGLWADPFYAIRQAASPGEVLAERGRFTLVEGKVLSVRESRGTIYVNFGRRWSEDFTATIPKRSERAFIAEGIMPKSLARRQVRVRGFVEERGGPWIELTRPEQIELVDQN